MSLARVLIVEDEILVASELEATLEDRGFRCVGIAPDLTSAMALAAEKPDVALVDINLRDGRTGPTIAERLSREHGVTVLYLTANPAMATGNPAMGVVGVLDKPFEENLVATALGFALDVRHGRSPAVPPHGLKLLGPAPGLELSM